MRLFYKVFFSLILLLILILSGYGYLGYQREVALFNDIMEKNEVYLGKSISGVIDFTVENSGTQKTMELIRNANALEHTVKIRWVNLDPSIHGIHSPMIPVTKLGKVLRGGITSLIGQKRGMKGEYRFTYVPLFNRAFSHSAIELSESLSLLRTYTRSSLLHLLFTALLILIAAGLFLWFQFQQWIHRPLALFTEKSRMIGEGDLVPDLVVRGKDEFAALGNTINSMCRALAASQEAARIENERRIEAVEQLRHSERLATLGRLSAGMAHEIGTPLNVISGRSKMIRSGDLEAGEIIESAGIIEEQARRITTIMRSLLDFARRRKPNRSPQDIETLINQVLGMLTPSATKAEVVFSLTRRVAIPPLSVDPIQIEQVITNLVMNGIQSMDTGGHLEVALSAEERQPAEPGKPSGTYLAVSIKDEGPGIPEEIREHIFEPFYHQGGR